MKRGVCLTAEHLETISFLSNNQIGLFFRVLSMNDLLPQDCMELIFDGDEQLIDLLRKVKLSDEG